MQYNKLNIGLLSNNAAVILLIYSNASTSRTC